MDATQTPDNQPVGGDYGSDITNLQNQINDLTKISEDLNTAVTSPTPLQYPIDTISYNSIADAFPNILGGGLPASPVQGDISYYNGTAWVSLAPGTSGQLLETLGAGANPQWTTSGLPSAAEGAVLVYDGSSWTGLPYGPSGEFLQTLGAGAQPQWAMAVATGSVMLFSTATPPTGYLLCNGQAVSRSTYSTLYGLIGYTYGNPGGGNFNLPLINNPFRIPQLGPIAQIISGSSAVDIFTTPGTFNWVCPTGVTSIQVECYGGGASGTADNSNAAGGGGGGYGVKAITVVPGSSYLIVVGIGGASAASGGHYNNGTDSYFISPTTVAGKGAVQYTGGSYVGTSGYSGGTSPWTGGSTGGTGGGRGGTGGTSGGLYGSGGSGGAGNNTGGSGAGGGGTSFYTAGVGGGTYLGYGGVNGTVGTTYVSGNGGGFGGGGAGFYGAGSSGAGGNGAVYITYSLLPMNYIIKT